MNDKPRITADIGQIEIVVGALYVSLLSAFRHIAKEEGPSAASAFKEKLLAGITNGDISMSLLDDAAAFELVVSMINDIEVVNEAELDA